ncbi:MAG TPA: alanine--tRNA ligase [Gaiellaceae bacterium]|nr:alanine--tRNA ligase [Gaiellaceae bacterium]
MAMTTNELREAYLAFFEERGHLRCPSYSLIPRADDHSTLLTSAGMQPQMPFFLGREQPPAPLTTTAQKVFRTVDIDEVGRDTFHLTFFEMLGNFSFGQYFKQGAIEFAREFMVDRLGLDWDRIWVSVHAGDPGLKLGPDDVAIQGWLSVGMPRERITPLPSSENFWSVGGPGPCGPDSEIYWDWGEETGCGEADCKPGCTRCERFLEFWNLVFMEYELHPDGTLTPLPKQNIDTGMGLERIARIVQNVPSVYDTDGYQAIMNWIASASGNSYGSSRDATKAHRVLADHGRGMCFIVAEGVTPSNEARGYVLRRIIRRAVQHGLRIGLESPFLPGLADAVIEQMGGAYPELVDRRDEIHRVLSAEEERFAETLARGMKVFEELAGESAISADDAFTLATTYGFPIELTQELAEERGQPVDVDRFNQLMDEHRTVSRAGGDRSDAQRAAEFARDAGFATQFVGYAKTDVLTQIGALQPQEDGAFLCKLRESPFYPDGGGQVTDAGELVHEETGAVATLRAAYRIGDDQALVFAGEGFAAGDRVRAVVPWTIRFPTMANHTATHLLHAALRDVLGEHVHQAGSSVRPDKLRFDFTHGQAMTAEEREKVERIVNEKVFEAIPVRTFVTPIEEARKLGAMMLFGEKYGDEVRVVEIDGFSRELCGGTHVRSTAEIGPFVILSEGSVGSGARRIEAVTAGEAWALLDERARELEAVRAELEQARRDAKKPKQAAAGPDFVWTDKQGTVFVAEVKGAGNLRDLSDQLRQQEAALAVVLASVDEGKVSLVVNLDKSLEGLDAVKIVRELGPIIGGGGGGRPTLAEAGGKNVDAVRDALAAGLDKLAAAIG